MARVKDLSQVRRQNRLLGPGPRPIGPKVRLAARPLFQKRGLAEGDVALRWTEIVGDTLAQLSSPMRLSGGPKSGQWANQGQQGGVLTVRVAGAAAPEISHLTPQIIERVNVFYGYRAVDRLKIEQGPLPRVARKVQKRLRSLSDSEKKELEASLSGIKSAELKDRLAHLGRLIKTADKN